MQKTILVIEQHKIAIDILKVYAIHEDIPQIWNELISPYSLHKNIHHYKEERTKSKHLDQWAHKLGGRGQGRVYVVVKTLR